jgi:phage-related protein
MDDAAAELGVSVLDMFGSIEAGQAFAGLAADLDKTQANFAAVTAGTGATQIAFNQMEQGIGPVLDKLKARFDVILIGLGEAIAPAAELIGGALLGMLEAFQALPQDMQTGIILIGTAAAGLIALSISAGLMKGALGGLGGAFSLLAANPALAIIAALAIGAILIWQNWDKVKEKVGEVADWLGERFDRLGALWDTFISGDISGFAEVADFMFGNTGKLIEPIANPLKFAREKFEEFKSFVSDIGSDISDVWDDVYARMIQPVIDFSQRVWEVLTPLRDVVGWLVGAWLDVAMFFVNTAITFFTNWANRFRALLSNLWNWIKNSINFLQTTVIPIFVAAWNIIYEITQTIWGAITAALSVVWDIIVAVITTALSIAQTVISTAWDVIQTIFQTASDTITGILNTLLEPIGGVSGAIDTLKNGVETAMDFVIEKLQWALDQLIEITGKMKEAIGDVLGPVGGFLGDVGGKALHLLCFDEGGVVPGPKGSPQLILAHGGETVVPTHKSDWASSSVMAQPVPQQTSGSAGTVQLHIYEPVNFRHLEAEGTQIARIVQREVTGNRAATAGRAA